MIKSLGRRTRRRLQVPSASTYSATVSAMTAKVSLHILLQEKTNVRRRHFLTQSFTSFLPGTNIADSNPPWDLFSDCDAENSHFKGEKNEGIFRVIPSGIPNMYSMPIELTLHVSRYLCDRMRLVSMLTLCFLKMYRLILNRLLILGFRR